MNQLMNLSRLSRWPIYFALCLLAQIETLVLAPREDSAVRLFVAERMTAGDVFGRDIWDNKLPPIYLVGQAANATGHPQVALWILEAALTALGALVVDELIRRFGKAAAALSAACVMCLASGLPSLHAGGYMTEIYSLALAAMGVLFADRAVTQGNRGLAVISGLCWGLSVAFRMPMILAAVPVVAVLTIRVGGKIGLADGARSISAIGLLAAQLAGGILSILLVFAHPAARGYLADCLHVAIDWPLNLSHVRIPGPLTATTNERLKDFAQDLLKTAWVQVPALIGYGLVLSKRSGQAVEERRLIVACLIWHLASLASGLAGWASYGHYLYVSLAPAAVGIGALLSSFGPSRQRAAAWAYPLIALIATGGLAVDNIVKRRGGTADSERGCIAREVHAIASPSESVFCWISGRDARLLSMIGHPTGNPHIIAPSYFVMDLRLLDEWALHMLARPPEWIVEDRELRRPSIRDADRYKWESTLPGMASVQRFVLANYREEAKCGRFVLMRRIDGGLAR